MTLIRANIQTVNDIYRVVWTAVSKKQPIEARYAGVPDACPHRLGRNRFGERRVLYYQYESKRESCAFMFHRQWRCQVLEKLSRVRQIEGSWRTAPNNSRPAGAVGSPQFVDTIE